MSEASKRGKDYERHISKMTAKMLKLDIKRDSRSGAGLHKADVRDVANLLPLFIECKDHEKITPKKWWIENKNKAPHGQAPVIVLPFDNDDMAFIRYKDLLSFIREAMDWRESYDALRTKPILIEEDGTVRTIQNTAINDGFCRAGHIADENNYCMIKSCEYSRGYRKPKQKGWKK